MIVRVLGSAAGGGVPQWNCACSNCSAARAGDALSRDDNRATLVTESGEEAFGVMPKTELADLILVDGDPTENLKLIADPETNFVVIMKGGRLVKNALT